MNAINHNETQAIANMAANTAAVIDAEYSGQEAIEQDAQAPERIQVPLSQLRASRRNVRKTGSGGQSIASLAASIERVGLLQNLTVTASPNGEHYEVVAGGRRLAALKLLVKTKQLDAQWLVPCLLVQTQDARTVSLTENVQREAMHPADQFEAFAALVKEGRPIEDIAADFGVTPLVVQRRLKLANVSPRLMADYRADQINLEQLMALSITDDHAAQEAAFYDAPEWQRGPHALRGRLTERDVDASHPLVRFVGLDAYEAAGGSIRRDLFAEDDSGIYLDDVALLERLVQEKLDTLAEPVRAEGWAWVQAVPQFSYADRQAFYAAPQEDREPNAREARRMAVLQGRIERTDAELDDAYEAEAANKVQALESRRDALMTQLAEIEESLFAYTPETLSVAGVVVSIDREGQPVIHRGLMREAEAKALHTLERLRHGFTQEGIENEGADSGGDDAPAKTAISDRLAQRLSAHRTAAVQVELSRKPQVALAVLAHNLVQATLQESGYWSASVLEVKASRKGDFEQSAPDWPDSPTAVALHEQAQAWRDRLPSDSDALLAYLIGLPQEELLNLLALCTALTVNLTVARASQPKPGQEIAQAVALDMSAWWQPTAESYFQHLPKAAILAAVGEFAPGEVNRLSKLKKAAVVSEAERLVQGKGWMPAFFTHGTVTPEDTENGEHEDAPPFDVDGEQVWAA
ncbi:ParB/RepB/Spo0J family partition protein [Alcaligenes faecalis]|uniref:ParB/RepB/Spo0J family partition protein n=1 Tax=Alcaligenes faecalis TaxID=511 RepID=UPI001EEFEBAB|nr:ParB/RepB/Spo0J family partition protein [Alcaligenes faecalis]ULH06462.1 ParB/RepB/Spo0J family partition protein [Alcaligenes faecalis]